MHLPALCGTRRATIHRCHALALALAFGTAGLAPVAAQAQRAYAVTELPVLPGSAQCAAFGLNDIGEVVGYCAPVVDDWNQTAVVWRQGRAVALGKWTNGTYGIASVINNFGRIAGHADSGNLRPQGWTSVNGGGWVDFFPNKSGNTYPLYVSDSGWIGGYFIAGSGSRWTGAIWTPSAKDPRKFTTVKLPELPGAADPRSNQSIPNAFNRGGVAVGHGFHDRSDGSKPLLWRNDARRTVEVLPPPIGGTASMAMGINDQGQVVGVGWHPTQAGYMAILWSADASRQPSLLPALPGHNSSQATAINNLGQVLGVSAVYRIPEPGVTLPPARPVVWRDGQTVDLQAAIEATGVTGLRLDSANAINAQGQIAGTAWRNGLKRAVVLQPVNF